MRVASNGTASADAPQCGQKRLPSGTVREQDVHVIGGAYTRRHLGLRDRVDFRVASVGDSEQDANTATRT